MPKGHKKGHPHKEFNALVYKDAKIELWRDSLCWKICEANKGNGNHNDIKYFSSIQCLFEYMINRQLVSKIVEHGLLDTLNMLEAVKKEARLIIETMSDSLEAFLKKYAT